MKNIRKKVVLAELHQRGMKPTEATVALSCGHTQNWYSWQYQKRPPKSVICMACTRNHPDNIKEQEHAP